MALDSVYIARFAPLIPHYHTSAVKLTQTSLSNPVLAPLFNLLLMTVAQALSSYCKFQLHNNSPANPIRNSKLHANVQIASE